MDTTATIRSAKPDDTDAIMNLADAIGLFEGEELEELGNMLAGYFDGSLGEEHSWIVCENDGVVGVAYFAPEQYAYGTWNLYLIAVHPKHQGKGNGAAMLRQVEQTLFSKGERLLLVETSGLPNFELTRKFYRKQGYEEEARIREFYKAGDDKIIFRKVLVTSEH
ncbi:GNAT family N-acetyltransferase [Rivularia sp. UHCC 0363]|uniref:GNAT family N-acetyltransferase n=1 Tax=Rivularia sp. UHCC 0363 TaxID=3110244 RepID=UPI002B20D914|nr:GNAT family N-acetyltransferase [Rivularia sp. UHCC 0363]MEA5595281.1 GNAT family N-acetyltransferase [Rivularia sp. UHCC 0363]